MSFEANSVSCNAETKNSANFNLQFFTRPFGGVCKVASMLNAMAAEQLIKGNEKRRKKGSSTPKKLSKQGDQSVFQNDIVHCLGETRMI